MSNVRLSVRRENVWRPASCEEKATKESILKRQKGNFFSVRVVRSIKLRLIVMPTNWNVEKEKDREKEKVKETFFVGGTT